MELIDKNKLLEELEKLKQNLSASPIVVIEDVESLVESFEVKEVDLEKEEPVSKDLEEAAMRIATRHSHITGDTYYANDAWFFKKGAQWQKQQLIEKACEWLKSYRQDTYDGTGYIAGIVNDKTIEEFRQAMEE